MKIYKGSNPYSTNNCLFFTVLVSSNKSGQLTQKQIIDQEYTYESFPAYLIPEYCILIDIVVGGG
jgi:hypothetical protein